MPSFMGTHKIDSPIHGDAEISNRMPQDVFGHTNASTTKNNYDSPLNETFNAAQMPADKPWNVNDQAVGK